MRKRENVKMLAVSSGVRGWVKSSKGRVRVDRECAGVEVRLKCNYINRWVRVGSLIYK